MNPSVSVVMSVYNGEEYLNEAIDSILSQTFKSFEFIIINDGSTDSSSKIIRSYTDSCIVLIEQENTGLSKALNIGIGRARSDLIARMDADDINMPERIKLQYEFLKEHPECVAVGSNAEVIDMNGNYIFTSDQTLTWEEIKTKIILKSTPFFHSSTMFRTRIFKECGGYNIKLYTAQDGDLFYRMSRYGELRNIQDILIKYRITPYAISRKTRVARFVQKRARKLAMKGVLQNNYYNWMIKVQTRKRSNSFKYYNYHILLAKKYLWNNYDVNNARHHLKKAFNYKKFSIQIIVLFLLSYIDSNVIKTLYRHLKLLK